MPLEQISNAVLTAARTEADHIEKAARMAAEEKVQKARRSIEQDNERRYQAAVRGIDEEFYRKLTQVAGAAKKVFLTEKSRRLQDVFESARTEILALPEGEYLAIMQRLLEAATEGHGGQLRVHASEQARFDGLVSQFNAAHPAQAPVALDTATPLPEPGGFVFVSETYEVDQTLRSLLADLEYRLAPEVAAAMFSGEGRAG